MDAGQFVQTIEKRQGLKIACLEEIAFENGWLNQADILKNIEPMANSSYGQYVRRRVT